MYITGGKILTMTGQVLECGTLHIEKGKIAEIREGMVTKEAVGEKEKMITLQGSWVMPGLVEAHCHMGIMEEKKGNGRGRL